MGVDRGTTQDGILISIYVLKIDERRNYFRSIRRFGKFLWILLAFVTYIYSFFFPKQCTYFEVRSCVAEDLSA